MPSPADFRRAFELQRGALLGGKQQFEIEASVVGHEVKEENELYEFPTTLEVRLRAGSAAGGGRQVEQRRRQLAQAFKAQARDSRIVYSAYGSPYQCTYGPPSVTAQDEEGRSFRLAALGRAARRRDIPTLAHQHDAEQAGAVEDEVSAEDRQRHLRGYRIIKSRWASGKCALCGGGISHGARIAKRQGDASPGGWAHEACAVRQRKAAAGSTAEESAGGEEPEGEMMEQESAGQAGRTARGKKQVASGGGTPRKRRRGGGSAGSTRKGKTSHGKRPKAEE